MEEEGKERASSSEFVSFNDSHVHQESNTTSVDGSVDVEHIYSSNPNNISPSNEGRKETKSIDQPS